MTFPNLNPPVVLGSRKEEEGRTQREAKKDGGKKERRMEEGREERREKGKRGRRKEEKREEGG